ncbi:MAG TPA: DNA methyltransferase [Pirellulales bacterium]|nr:DNA methyltransferase [Pirellulales bacterium]
MQIDFNRIRDCLKRFEFQNLFVEELGWDRPPPDVQLTVGGKSYKLRAVAQKRGFVVYEWAAASSEPIPDSTLGRKIDRELTKHTREHIIVFTDAAHTMQVWQWVKREAGTALSCRRHTFHVSQPGDSLLQKLDKLFVSLDEEEDFSIVDAAGRVRAAFDVERVTKRFFERFQAEHEAFLGFVRGIREQGDREWYASLMLNRLMFIYFIQKRRFLDGDVDYLHNRLTRVKLLRGKDKFHSFYRQFLLRLFHEGLGKPPHERQPDLEELLGSVPYLNGGLFDQHELERANPDLEIPDSAFERVFAFFEEFDWTLEPRPPAYYAANPRAREEINPDILGYIFEKYINQKEMGAYYTKEDITDYISKNTIIPFLLDAARKDCAVAFGAGRPLWRLLEETPDAYLYKAVRAGVIDDDGQIVPLPAEIAAGLDDVSRRGGWNKPADAPFALPTETWREHVARRRRCLELRAKLAAGEVHEIDDLITYNLDIRRFALDAIENCEGAEFLRAFYQALARVSVLDPTCGSGAFLFAALNVLEPLYEACLDRMQEFVDDADASGTKRRKEAIDDFRQTLDRVAAHPSRAYFIHKSIVVNNLYGVDVMEEAVEICKLRLFLKLVAQVDDVRHLEPLPDIDFNIRAGNTLVGFTSLEEIRKSQEGKLAFSSAEIAKIEVQATAVDRQFKRFRALQTNGACEADSAAEIAAAKNTLRGIQAELGMQLDQYLAGEYGVDASDGKQAKRFHEWRENHRPFHWFVDFYGVLANGGFDVIIGNPPYVELSDVRSQYNVIGLSLVSTGNLYSLCVERCRPLLQERGHFGVIVPISAISTPRMLPLMRFLVTSFSCLHAANFAVRPGKLFTGVDMNLTILLGCQPNGIEGHRQLFSTQYNRWQEPARQVLFQTLSYAPTNFGEDISSLPKMASDEAASVLVKIMGVSRMSALAAIRSNGETVYYHSGGRYFRKCLREKLSNEYKELSVPQGSGDAVLCLLSSSLYYWFWISISDCYHVTKRDIAAMPFPATLAGDSCFHRLADRLLGDLWTHAQKRQRNRANGEQREEVNFDVSKSKPILDEIDAILARHFGLSPEEMDMIVNYDAKYRITELES